MIRTGFEGVSRHCEQSEAIQQRTLTRPSGTLSQRKRVINAPQDVTNSLTYSPINLLTSKRAAFTLAEILITLAIIGVVAALTIPTLVAQNQQRGWNTAATVFERKLGEALKIMNSQGTLAGYKDTSSFVNELSKHLKIVKVCDNNNLASCFEDKVNWNVINISHPEQKTSVIDISSIKNASDLGKDDWNTQVLGFQLNNGTSGLLAYNPKCRQDQFNNQITGTSCVSVIYDTSGFSMPNTFTKDVRSVNSSLGKCAFVSDSACFGAPFMPTPHEWKGCDENGVTTDPDDLAFINKTGIRHCMSSSSGTNDYWAGAVELCGHVSKMPTMAQLAEIANYIYNTDKIQAKNNVENLTRDDDKASSLGFKNFTSLSVFYVWSGEENSRYYTYYRIFDPSYTKQGNDGRSYSNTQAVCLSD